MLESQSRYTLGNIVSTYSAVNPAQKMDKDLYGLFQKAIMYENRVEDVRKELADRPDFDPLQCYVELHRPRNLQLCYKHFQIYFDSKSIPYLQRELDYIVLNYSDKNDYKMEEHKQLNGQLYYFLWRISHKLWNKFVFFCCFDQSFYDIILTHTDFMSCQIILGRQKKTFSAIIGTMHFKTQDLFTDLFRRELEQYRQVEKAKMQLFDKYGFSIFEHPLLKQSPLKFNDLLDFMTEMDRREEEAKQKAAEELQLKKEQEALRSSSINSHSRSQSGNTNNHNLSQFSQNTKFEGGGSITASVKKDKNIEQDKKVTFALQEGELDPVEQKKAEILAATEALWRRMHQNNRKKYVVKTFSRLREYVVPQDYFEHAKVERKKLEFDEKEYFQVDHEGFRSYTTNQKRGKKMIDAYSNEIKENPWKSSEQMPINLKFSSNLYDQKTNQGDKFFKDFTAFHKRQLRQNQYI